MIIKQFSSLASNDVRRDILTIAEAGYEAIRIDTIVQSKLSYTDGVLRVGQYSYRLSDYKRVGIVGFGKGSAQLAASIEKLVGNAIVGGVVIDIAKAPTKKVHVFVGTHPLPTEQNIKATKKLVEFVKYAQEDDLIIAVICGGGSSLLCDPANMSCTDLAAVAHKLLLSGASIQQINTVRKHLSRIHGGFLAEYVYPARLLALVVSDVPGNDLSMVASGPTILDTTTLAEAHTIAEKYHLPNLALIETPKAKKYFKHTKTQLLASGLTAVEGMKAKAIELGYKPVIVSRDMHGMASLLGVQYARRLKPGMALLACGESQVTVKHAGRGGRNQDLALSAMDHLPRHAALLSAASDGKDNIPVAGGIVDSEQASSQAQRMGLHATHAVAYNQSYNSLQKIGGIFHIEHVTANVSDFVVAIQQEGK